MNQQRPNQFDQANFQQGRSVPPNHRAPPGNPPLYNPNQYQQSQQHVPENGSWASGKQQHSQAKDPWEWDENVNNYHQPNYPPSDQGHTPAPAGAKLHANPTHHAGQPMYNVPDYSVNQPLPNAGYQPEHLSNNNQMDPSLGNGNQKGGWTDQEDWGWNNEYSQQQEPYQQPHSLGHMNVVESNSMANSYHSLPPGIEQGLSSMSLTSHGQESIPPVPTQQEEPPSTTWHQPPLNDEPTASWSRTPTWGSSLDHAAGYPEYPPELGERNTFADGASFTDPNQQPAAPLAKSQVYTPPTGRSMIPETSQIEPPPPQQQLSFSNSSRNLPPLNPTLEESPNRASPSFQGPPTVVPSLTEDVASPAMSSPRVNTGLPTNLHGLPQGTLDSAQSVPFSGAAMDGSTSYRLPATASRSQSGTPSLERETERPDAEGAGYENDQPTPLVSQTSTASNVTAGSASGTSFAGSSGKVAQESPVGSRPASRQAGTPSTETPPTVPYHPSGGESFSRPKPLAAGGGFYPNAPAPPLSTPNVARGSQEAVGSEFGPPPSSVLPPSSQRMIPGSISSQGPPLLTVAPALNQQQQHQKQQRPAGSVTPVSEQRIVTGFAKNDPVPVAPVGLVQPPPVAQPAAPVEESRSQESHSRSPPPPHRSETIGSENPRANATSGVLPLAGAGAGNGSADRSDDRISTDRERDRDREPKAPDNRSRVERDRERDRDHEYDRDGRNRYPEDEENERFSLSFRERDRDRDRDRDRRYEGDRDRDRDRERDRRYPDDRDPRERDRGFSRDYDDDRRSGYGPVDRDRARDPRRRDPRRSDYYYTDADVYERSGGRRSSLYEGENNDPTTDFDRSYGFNSSRDGRRRDTDRSRLDDRYYPGHGSRTNLEPERAQSEREYRHNPGLTPGGRRDPRDPYYQDPRYYGYDPYRTSGYPVTPASAAAAAYSQYYNQQMNYALKYNYALFEEMRLKNPAAYSEWYRNNYAQRYGTASTVITGPASTSARGSIAATSEADRASVHSGRSSVNDDPNPSMLANHSMRISQQIRGLTTGLEQTNYDEYSVFQEEDPASSTVRSVEDMTPHKFSCPHVIGRFSPSGILLRVLPNSPKDGVAAHIELHDLNVLLGELPSAQELKFFPGPLVAGQTHKQQVAVFCQQKIRYAMDESHHLMDRQSYILLWELLLLLLRQNGTIVGTDIAELLLKDHEILREPVIQEVVSSPGDVEVVTADRTLVSRHTEASVTKKFRELLLFGNKKEALEWAMAQGLWGHALFLASKMDQRTYASVMIRFANGLALTDPLQTLYQLMSGRQPTAVTSCGDDKWGDWRPHLAMILSNSTSGKSSNSSDLDKKSIITLGDTLSAKGFLLAAHFCYLVAQVDFGSYSSKASKLVLLSSSSSQSFEAFASCEAIQCTEIYEYARQLAAPEFVITSFQSYKFLYATRLAEHGRAAEALQYCEAIGTVLTRNPSAFSPALINQVSQLGSMLKFNDPQYLTENDGTTIGDPAWLTALEAAAVAASAMTPSEEYTGEKLVFEPVKSTGENLDASTPTDYSSYQQQGQYSDPQQQQSYYTQQPYYEQQPSGPQSDITGSSAAITEQQQQNNLQNFSQQSYDYTTTSQSQNPNNSWQQPQQQQQWDYTEPTVPSSNGGSTDYYYTQNNTKEPLVGADNGSDESSSSVSDDESGRADREPVELPSVVATPSLPPIRDKRVVFKGTFPIDQPLRSTLNRTEQQSRLLLLRQRQMSLTLRSPRTFAIDEPIREEEKKPVESMTSTNEGPYASSDPYNTNQSSFNAPETKQEENNKTKASSSNSAKAAAARAQQSAAGGTGWLGGFFNKFKPKTQMKLPDDTNPTIVWDPKKGQWVDTAKDGEDEIASLAPPPKDASFQSLPPMPTTPAFSSPMAPAPTPVNNNNEGNRFGLNKGRGGRGGGRNYVNPGNIKIMNSPLPAPLLATTPVATAAIPSTPQFFIPSPAPIDPSAPSDFVSSPIAPVSDPASQQQDPAEPYMYKPTQLAPPPANTGRPGLSSRGRYPR